MRDAVGGTFSLTAIVIFLIIVNCFLAFSVNYTKAFRAKNEIRSIIEKNEGLTCDAIHQIEEFFVKYNYHISDEEASSCDGAGYKVARGNNNTALFCYKVEKADVRGTSEENLTYKGAYYTIATYVNINIPLFNRLFDFARNIFMVTGETALIYSSGVNYEALDRGITCGT